MLSAYSNVWVEAVDGRDPLLKPFEDTIYIDSVPVIEYKSGADGFLYSIR